MNNDSLWTLLSVLGAAGAAGFGCALCRLHRAISQARPGYLMPQLRVSYDPQTVARDAAEIPQFAIFRGWMFGALAALWVVLAAVSRNAAPWLWLRDGMLALATAAWLFGVVENALLPRRGRVAAFFGRAKWAMGIFWVAGMFVGLMAKGFAQF